MTPSTFVDDPFKHRFFVPDQALQTLTCNRWLKSLDTQQFQDQRKQFTKYNKLKRAAASSLSELAQRRALEKLEVITARAVETPRNKLEIEVLLNEPDHSSDNLSDLHLSSQSQLQSRSQSLRHRGRPFLVMRWQ